MRVLAGDIGGTHARLALVEVRGTQARVLQEQQFHSRDFPGLGALVQRFQATLLVEPERACFGVAGPVIDGHYRGTNLPWTIEERELGAAIGIAQTRLINDFAAVGHGLPLLGPDDVETLQPGTRAEGGAIAVIGAGLAGGALSGSAVGGRACELRRPR